MFALITHVIEQFFRFAQAGIERFGIYAVALSKASRLDWIIPPLNCRIIRPTSR